MKVIQFLFVTFTLLLLSSCNSSSENKELISEIENEVETINKSCPYYFGMGNDVTLEKVIFGDKTLTYHYNVKIVPILEKMKILRNHYSMD